MIKKVERRNDKKSWPNFKMAATPPNPELSDHLTKVICVKLNEGRVVHGTLIGYDHFMNLSLRNVKVESPGRPPALCDSCILRGAAILSFEAVNPT